MGRRREYLTLNLIFNGDGEGFEDTDFGRQAEDEAERTPRRVV